MISPRIAVLFGAIALSLAMSGGGMAAPAEKAVTIHLTQMKIVHNVGKPDQLVEADHVGPGDVIEYQATYTNVSARPIHGLVATLPIPDGLDYLANTAHPAGELAATTDNAFSREPLMTRTSTGALEPVPYRSYRTLRWTYETLAPHQVVTVSARVKVESATASSAPSPAPSSAH